MPGAMSTPGTGETAWRGRFGHREWILREEDVVGAAATGTSTPHCSRDATFAPVVRSSRVLEARAGHKPFGRPIGSRGPRGKDIQTRSANNRNICAVTLLHPVPSVSWPNHLVVGQRRSRVKSMCPARVFSARSQRYPALCRDRPAERNSASFASGCPPASCAIAGDQVFHATEDRSRGLPAELLKDDAPRERFQIGLGVADPIRAHPLHDGAQNGSACFRCKSAFRMCAS